MEASQYDTLVLEDIPVVIVLFSTHTSELSLFLTLHIIVGNVPIGKEILDLEGIELLLVLDYLYGGNFFLFGDQSGWDSILEDADFWEHEPYFSR